MASSRKKQDENNLKTLRELGALPQNKFCFDCGQRGPTYVNVTIGSFVCTKCSGILRGVTPPHRVKSISMATFTAEEIDTLRNKGNEYCRRMWLGLYEGTPPTHSGDEQHVRDFMVEKYERKRYYLEKGMTKPEAPNTRPGSAPTPSIISPTSRTSNGFKSSTNNNVLNNGTKSKGTTNGIITNGSCRSRPEVKNNVNNSSLGNGFAVDFDKADIFSNTSTSSSSSSQSPQQNGFADFEHNPVFNNANQTLSNDDFFSIFDLQFTSCGPTLNEVPLFAKCNSSNRWSMPTPSTLNAWASQTPANGVGRNPLITSTLPTVEDKYAALKDLDNEMKNVQQQHPQDVWSTSTGSTGSLYSSTSTPTTGSVYGSPSPQGSIFGSPTQGQFMNGFTPLQENSTTPNPFGTSNGTNPWAMTNGSCNGPSNGFTNGINIGMNGVTNGIHGIGGLNGVHSQSQQPFINPFRDQGKANGFSNVLQPIFPSNGVPVNGLSNGWGANPFKAGTVTTMNSNNPFL